MADALADPRVLATVSGPEAARARQLGDLLAAGARLLGEGASAETVLWHVWDGTRWPARLRDAAESAGASGTYARSAHRDLDAVVALFDLAARVEERQRGLGLQAFLDEIDEQQIPADSLAERGVRGDGVRLLTAHRAKGLQWRLVVVAGVQDGAWPDLRRRGSLLHADRIDPAGIGQPASRSALLADERRLFYVAVTRARERLVVTAVASPSEGGDQPSRFVSELGVPVPDVPEGRPRRPLSLRGLLGELREIAETTTDDAVRHEAARRIARLVGTVPAADPDRWWGVHDASAADTPVRPAAEPLALSGSALDSLMACPLRWFLAREAGGHTASTVAQGFGSLVHGLAEAVVRGEVEADVDAMVAHLDDVWDQLDFAVPWASVAERREAEKAIARLVAWHTADRGREVLAVEHEFSVALTVAGDEVVLRGYMDRVERDTEGRVVVVDFKTGKSFPRDKDVAAHPQLGVYQVAVRAGAAAEIAGPDAPPGGAELVHLRRDVRGKVKIQHQPAPSDDDAWVADEQLAQAVRTVRDEDFVATVGRACDYCEFRACCPAQPEGGTIVLGAGATAVTAVAAPPVRLRDEQHLVEVLGTPLSDEQLRAVTAPLEPSVVVAGAGSGKTTVMCARVVWLVGRGMVAPEQVLGLTFSRKAAAELASRIRVALARLGPVHDGAADRPLEAAVEVGEPTVSTYHAYAGSLITEHGLRLGIEPDLRVVADATRYQLAARVVAGAPASATTLSHHLPTVVEYVLELDSQLQDHLVSPDAVHQHDRRLRARLAAEEQTAGVLRAVDVSGARDDLLGLVAAYRQAKDEAGIAEFADQMAGGARLAIECPEVGDAERERFRVVLLDEYQDTSVSQRRMLQGLFADDRGRGHPVTAVGDPCQAIYGWRGASADNIDAFPQHFPKVDGSEAALHHLTVNRRCASGVLDLANLLAQPLYEAHPSGRAAGRTGVSAAGHGARGAAPHCRRRGRVGRRRGVAAARAPHG